MAMEAQEAACSGTLERDESDKTDEREIVFGCVNPPWGKRSARAHVVMQVHGWSPNIARPSVRGCQGTNLGKVALCIVEIEPECWYLPEKYKYEPVVQLGAVSVGGKNTEQERLVHT
jgi:hypothetical protein